jgi:GTP pyrophosphokinase
MNYDIAELLALKPQLNPEEQALITRAFEFSKQAHETQQRNSGEPYFYHLFKTAEILASMNADAVTIAAGLLRPSSYSKN